MHIEYTKEILQRSYLFKNHDNMTIVVCKKLMSKYHKENFFLLELYRCFAYYNQISIGQLSVTDEQADSYCRKASIKNIPIIVNILASKKAC